VGIVGINCSRWFFVIGLEVKMKVANAEVRGGVSASEGDKGVGRKIDNVSEKRAYLA
jgi:hypothetical protein